MSSSLDELKARRKKGFTKPKVEYDKPGPLSLAAIEAAAKTEEKKQ